MPGAFLRLRRDDYTGRELKAWVKQIQKQEWRQAYVFFKHDDIGNGPKLAKSLLKLVA